MENKMRQVTDNIHGTIYLSALESELISTPYFYRLHDIYQSSTVYMTFPSNRTKRYEHSLGTMELASSMLFSSISNADQSTRNILFKKLHGYFEQIFDLAIFQSENQNVPYFIKCKAQIDGIFGSISFDRSVTELIEDVIQNNIIKTIEKGGFKDTALDHFQYYQLSINNKESNPENLFLYRCMLQAIRIVALFHDVGHPPYSHIIEEVLNKLYIESDQRPCTWDNTKKTAFRKVMKPYAIRDNTTDAYKCQMIYSTSSSVEAQLHESVGLSLLQSTINDVIPEIILKVTSSKEENESHIAKVLYYIFVVELAMAILTEKDVFFESLHKLVDGVLDADRLDYIMRDSLNSGVDWGKIPYKRLINSAKMFYITKDATGKDIAEENRPFVIAYPNKVQDDIVDILLTRYKIFARINFHHRCMKTSVALQSAVFELAEDYLSAGKDETCINSDIGNLWQALNVGAGSRQNRIIQWNDSWLISVLHKSYINILKTDKTKEKNLPLLENLEEILLNRKRYYSLIKRGEDGQKFVKMAFEKAGITKQILDTRYEEEYEKYIQSNKELKGNEDLLQSAQNNAKESLLRIRMIKDIMETGDLGSLNTLIPMDKVCVNETIRVTLENLKKSGVIADYSVLKNAGRRKMGLPSHKTPLDEIYLYSGNQWSLFQDDETLRPQIQAIKKNIPWTYVYFVPPKGCDDIKELYDTIFEKLAIDVGESMKKRYTEMFGAY